jgi:nucleotide-binding universal stress UspA family protein
MSKSIVVGVDETANSLAALGWAANMAEESGARLVAVHVRHVAGVVSALGAGAGTADMYQALTELERISRENVAYALAGRSVQWQFDVRSGDPATELIAAASAVDATTIVVGGRQHGIVGGLVVGSVAQKLVRHSPVSVLVVRNGQAHRLDAAATAN